MVVKTGLSGIKGIIWDFDNVFYDYTAVPGLSDLCSRVYARIAAKLIDGLEECEAFAIASESYAVHGHSLAGFIPLLQARGESYARARDNLFHAYQEELFRECAVAYPHMFSRAPATAALFDALGDELDHCILTLSCSRRWAAPALESMGLRHVFGDAKILGFAEIDFVSKAVSPGPVARALELLNLPPESVAFVEDTKSHLEVAKRHFPAMTTVLKTDMPHAHAETYIDAIIRQPGDLLRHFAQLRRGNSLKPAAAACQL